ncbi:MAG: ABC transporter ATP-binding protein [Planctomycetia bacterium]|uniref:ABC transporter ATP-binding protein n=1 Tax=Candidatus Brocadia sapporoensis TaxID=392547 RepID=A0A1V6M1W7_9BACT|nr:ABC transporter ATP-binding protein [Candidatus Brocadia sapporoensis]MCC7239738.1 ABC transporter ATP-binding protein [Candidatus Brocadia sp.]QOJ05077.1 MAG: ABC transporter ATP-binding protein [Planctomycetia bacterium]TVL97987.1 MAG: ABC transporter ATP-binding protein [Candidatus Brocadia sp. BL1]MDG5996479.1 ABC transporter ATP-binding protein [Candidatus Brocadia sp.]MDG6006626.1 ABC transporter ATP-binding protein [Candidatus Brocadia sp.]
MGIIIKAENLGKKYIIGHQRRERYITLRDIVMHKMLGIGQRILHPLSPNKEAVTLEEFWALKDINFEIEQGDRVGIIGRNGAGKSTLLKILSRITEPTTGKVRLKGRVASLLEVGTGFHPELTGRENIYLNGAILGMAGAEIKRKFDDIVAFAEVEKFLDTPVKHYSSGMYVRLAFAVAAHLEPEILIVDEVLAVGDAQFQKKCLGKMEEVGSEGRTVLLVSHNMAAIQSLCDRVILLNHGSVVNDGNPDEVIQAYTSLLSEISSRPLEDRNDRKGNGKVRFTAVGFQNTNGEPCSVALSGQNLQIVCTYRCLTPIKDGKTMFSIAIETLTGEKLLLFRNDYTGNLFDEIPIEGMLICTVPRLPLIPGIYRITICAENTQDVMDLVFHAAELQVTEGDYFGTGRVKNPKFGPFLAEHTWEILGAPLRRDVHD